MTAGADLLVLSGTWPGDTTGYALAVRASLAAACPSFGAVTFVGPTEDRPPARLAGVHWVAVPLRRDRPWKRFLASLPGRDPAIVRRYVRARPAVLAAGREAAARARAGGRDLVVLYEDVPVAANLEALRAAGVGGAHVVRSHNPLVKGFAGLDAVGCLPARLAWRHELARIRRFERAVLARADRVWALSDDDAGEYARRLGVRVDGVFGLALDADRYRGVPAGDPLTAVHVGSADLRKGLGLASFVREAWPEVRRRVPGARLVLGGRGTEVFDDPRRGVEGLGRVDDERRLLARGRVFVNPQVVGAGVKLKSVVAMLAGRALASTPTGIEGVEGEAGRDFAVARPDALGTCVAALLADERRAAELGARAASTAAEAYSEERLAAAARSLFAGLVAGAAAAA